MRWMLFQTPTDTVVALTYNGEVITYNGEPITCGSTSMDISAVPLTAFASSIQNPISLIDSKMPLLLPANPISASGGGTLVIEKNNILSYAGTGTFVFPTMSDNDFLQVTSTTAFVKTLSCVACGRTFLKALTSTETTAAIGAFTLVAGTSSYSWTGMCSNASGDVFAVSMNGYPQKQVAGSSGFTSFSSKAVSWYTIASVTGAIYAGSVIGNAYAITGSPSAGRLVFRATNLDNTNPLDIGTTGSNAIEVYASTDANTTWTSPLAIRDVVSLGAGVHIYTTVDFPITGASIGFKFQSFARTTAPRYSVSEMVAWWGA